LAAQSFDRRAGAIFKVPSKDRTTVVAALGKDVRELPQELRHSLTWDSGKEIADQKSYAIATNVQVYFRDSFSPWQRQQREHHRLAATVYPKGKQISRASLGTVNRFHRTMITGWKAKRVQKCWSAATASCSTTCVYLPSNKITSKLTKKARVTNSRNIMA
jgi:IS30 family transposase